jgi:hypothetical protein
MKQGDMLYLPRGWWHTVLPVDEPTLHLTVTIVPPSGGDLLGWLSSRLKSSPVVRQNIPAWASPTERRAHWQQLRQVLETQLTEALFEEFVAEWSAKMMPPTRIGLPSSPAAAGSGIGPQALLRLACAESLHLLESEDGGFHFFANGTKWDCPAGFAAPLKELRGGTESSLERLGAMLAMPADRSRFVSFVAVLQMGGVLWARNPADE